MVIIALVKNKLSFLENVDHYQNVFDSVGLRSGIPMSGQTTIIYEPSKLNLKFEELKTELEKLLYAIKHFVRMTKEQRDKLKESGGVVKEYIDTFERVVQHPKFKQKHHAWRDLHRDTQAAIDFAEEKGASHAHRYLRIHQGNS